MPKETDLGGDNEALIKENQDRILKQMNGLMHELIHTMRFGETIEYSLVTKPKIIVPNKPEETLSLLYIHKPLAVRRFGEVEEAPMQASDFTKKDV